MRGPRRRESEVRPVRRAQVHLGTNRPPARAAQSFRYHLLHDRSAASGPRSGTGGSYPEGPPRREIRRRREAGLVTEETQALEEPYTPHLNPDFLRKYVAYAKRIYPIMTTEAMSVIEKKYLDIRKTGEAAGSSVPITPRQLEAIIRLAEAGARIRLSEAVTVDDADRAVRIVEYWMGKVAGEEGRFDI